MPCINSCSPPCASLNCSRARGRAEAEEEMHNVQQSAGAPGEQASAAKARLEDIAAEVEAAQGRLDSLRE